MSKSKVKCSQPAYERLYAHKSTYEPEKEEIIVSQPIAVKVNKPLVIKLHERAAPVGQLLYEDALRRSNFKKTVAKNHLSSSMLNSSQDQPTKGNKKNERFVAQKFIREYCVAL